MNTRYSVCEYKNSIVRIRFRKEGPKEEEQRELLEFFKEVIHFLHR